MVYSFWRSDSILLPTQNSEEPGIIIPSLMSIQRVYTGTIVNQPDTYSGTLVLGKIKDTT